TVMPPSALTFHSCASGLGFVIDHLSGEHVHLLLVFTWRGNNEMWESTYYKDLRDGGPFRLPPQGTHRGAICVWEFGAVAHEHLAWTRYLRSSRDEQAKRRTWKASSPRDLERGRPPLAGPAPLVDVRARPEPNDDTAYETLGSRDP